MSADPMAEKYYPLSPYCYCAGNPENVIDPNGRDWYTTIGPNNQVQYHYDENIKSFSDFERLKIAGGNYLGKTYLSTDKYYSLFGQVIQYKDSKGELTFEGQIYKSIDDLIIKHYSVQNNSENSMIYTEVSPEPSVDFFFNMALGEYNFTYSGWYNNRPFGSIREGTIYRAVNKDNMRLKIQQMPPIEPRRLGGYGLGYKEPEWYGCFMLIGKNNFNTVQIQFDKNNATLFRKAIDKQFAR